MSRKKHDQHEEHADERWLITYADMITLLMVFFIVLYSMATTDLKKFSEVAQSMSAAFNVTGQSSGVALVGETSGGRTPFRLQNMPPMQRDFLKVSSELTAMAVETGTASKISVNMNLEGIIISLSNEMIFEPGSADLRPESQEMLSRVAALLRMTPNQVRVEGHTDNQPTNDPRYPSNWDLSVARAVSIVRYLTDVEGIEPSRLAAAGMGEWRPVAPNDTRANRAQNRRADIVIIYPSQSRQFSIGAPITQETAPISEGETTLAP